MLFAGHAAQPSSSQRGGTPTPMTPDSMESPRPVQQEPYGFGDGERRPIWQEVLHKTRVRICRTPVGWKFDRIQGYITTAKSTAAAEAGGFDASVSAPQTSSGYAYHIEIIEDLDDGRLHDNAELGDLPFDNLRHAGIRESMPIPQISKIFYANTGRILNIGESDAEGNSPVLLLKRDTTARKSGNMTDRHSWTPEKTLESEEAAGHSSLTRQQVEIDQQILEESTSSRILSESDTNRFKLELPPHLDADWLAFEAFVEDDDNESSSSEDEGNEIRICDRGTTSITSGQSSAPGRRILDSRLVNQIRNISMRESSVHNTASDELDQDQVDSQESFVARSPFGGIVSSLSLLEMLIRLASLQEYEQKPHLTIHDPTLNFFLEETSTTGLKGEERWEARQEAKRRVGFDPYTDTPSK